MLYQRIGLVDQVDEDGNTIPGSAAEHAATKTRKMMRSTSSYYKDSQAAMTSEMMKNMAHIMKAVGDLVANVNAAKDDHRRKKKIFNPSRNQPSPYVRPEHLGRDHMQGLQPPLVPQPSSSAPPQQPQNKDMVWEVSKAVTQANSKKIPLSKSGVIDLVLAKLQVQHHWMLDFFAPLTTVCLVIGH